MSTATLAAPVAREQRLRLSCVDWKTYQTLLHALDGRHLRMTYCQGELEIMTTSSAHERLKTLLARLVEALTEELNVPVLGLGSMTFDREDLERGLEPDECWYIAHELDVRSKEQLDMDVDPPPDLVVEIEVSRSVLDRLSIFAHLGVPEIWRYDGERLRVLVLGADNRYGEVPNSPTFPNIPISGFSDHLKLQGQESETAIVRSFRAWVKKTAAR